MDNIEYTQVDKDILDFLKAVFFGSIECPIAAASHRAYRDLNRTIRFGEMPQEQRDGLRSKVTSHFKQEIPAMAEHGVHSQESYDEWHCQLCNEIRLLYRNSGVEFHIGQAQKWVNMTMKYLYICGAYSFKGIFQYLHIPIDNYVFTVAEKELHIPQPKVRWSRWDSYDTQYLAYQKELRLRICGLSPLRWEFKFWLQEARQVIQNDLP